MRTRYDLVIGMGMACSCSQALRRANLQLLSFPFDWVAPDTRDRRHLVRDLPARAHAVVRAFEDWLRIEDLGFVRPHETNGKDIYLNARTGLVFNHDFPTGRPLSETFPEVAGKYRRRSARLIELIRRSRNVLLVRIERPDLPGVTPVADCVEARQILADGFPGVNFSLLQLVCDPSRPSPNRRETALGEDIVQISFDYRSRDPSAAAYQPDLKLLAETLADRFSVADYRTREEIRGHKEALLRKKLAEAGCNTLLQFRWKRLKASIRKRLPGGPFKSE